MMSSKIIVYGAFWCSDCRRAVKLLNKYKIPHDWVNIDKDKEAEEFVKRVNNGNRSIPTIVFQDGTILVEPSNEELELKLEL